MKWIKEEGSTVLKIVSGNWITLQFFELIYKILGFVVVFPCLAYLLGKLPGLAGVSYLGQENIGRFFASPPAVLLGLAILMALAWFILFEVTAILLLCEKSWHRQRLSLFSLWRKAAARTASLLRPGRIAALCMLPVCILTAFSFINGYLDAVRMPEFILDYMKSQSILYGVYLLFLAVCNILGFLYLFGLPFLFFRDMTFPESWKESLRLLRGRKLTTALRILILTAAFAALLFLLFAAGVLALAGYVRLLAPGGDRRLLQFYLVRWINVSGIAGGALLSSFFSAAVICYYHKYQGDSQPMEPFKQKKRGTRLAFRLAAGFCVLIALIFFSETEIGGNVTAGNEGRVQIVAHRAGAAFAPENTLEALEGAVRDGADMAEIDVQQLADGTLIVMHDTNFKRTLGRDIYVWNADRGLIDQINAGERRIATLEEFLDSARNRIELMIEVKANGHERDIEKEVLKLVRSYDMENQCVVASMNLDVLRACKELAPRVRTVYISALLLAGQYDLEYVDEYSIETTALSRSMVLQSHSSGKRIYGWTANTKASVRKLIRCGTDGIITDNTALAGSMLEKDGKEELAKWLADVLN